jgi:hypothetical protein
LSQFFSARPSPTTRPTRSPTPEPSVIPTEGKSTCRHGFMVALPATSRLYEADGWCKKRKAKETLTTSQKHRTNPNVGTNNTKMSDACFISKSPYRVNSSTVKAETTFSFEKLVTIYQTTRCYIPEDSNSIFIPKRTQNLASSCSTLMWLLFFISPFDINFALHNV